MDCTCFGDSRIGIGFAQRGITSTLFLSHTFKEVSILVRTMYYLYFNWIFKNRDYINELRYFAYHNTGLHVVTVNFVAELQRFLENEGNFHLV